MHSVEGDKLDLESKGGVTFHSLKFTRCSLLVVKSLVTRCKICSLFLAELLVAKNHSLLVAEVARCKICLLLVAKAARFKKLLVTCYEKNVRSNVYLKPIKIDEFYLFILYFHLT